MLIIFNALTDGWIMLKPYSNMTPEDAPGIFNELIARHKQADIEQLVTITLIVQTTEHFLGHLDALILLNST